MAQSRALASSHTVNLSHPAVVRYSRSLGPARVPHHPNNAELRAIGIRYRVELFWLVLFRSILRMHADCVAFRFDRSIWQTRILYRIPVRTRQRSPRLRPRLGRGIKGLCDWYRDGPDPTPASNGRYHVWIEMIPIANKRLASSVARGIRAAASRSSDGALRLRLDGRVRVGRVEDRPKALVVRFGARTPRIRPLPRQNARASTPRATARSR